MDVCAEGGDDMRIAKEEIANMKQQVAQLQRQLLAAKALLLVCHVWVGGWVGEWVSGCTGGLHTHVKANRC